MTVKRLKYKDKIGVLNTIDKIQKMSQSARKGVGLVCCVVYKIECFQSTFEGLGIAGLAVIE